MEWFVYRNIFCLICNKAKLNNIDDTCLYRSSRPIDIGIEFSSIIDINIGQPAKVDVEDDHCGPVEIYDSITVFILIYIILKPFGLILSYEIILKKLFLFKNT